MPLGRIGPKIVIVEPTSGKTGIALADTPEVGARQQAHGQTTVVIPPSLAERYLRVDLFDGL